MEDIRKRQHEVRSAQFASDSAATPRFMGDESVSRHHTKTLPQSLSQSSPRRAPDVASDVTLDGTYVLLCDWHGQLVWKSADAEQLHIGDSIWKNAIGESREALRDAVARVTSLRETCILEIDNNRGQRFRAWLWPLNEPDVALCALAVRVPQELARLTDRERGCLRLLGQGKSTREIADELNIGLTTVHTHLRRSREKLNLQSAEALVGFAARYLASPTLPATAEAIRKQSG
jgi:DNA-binding CsgD family transcriptional regulator